jgi:hypothetical protein
MNLRIDSILTLAKGISAKREKQPDDTEKVIVHLKFHSLVIQRDVIDALLRQPDGWSAGTLFDDMGAPIAHMDIALPALELGISGTIAGAEKTGEHIMLGSTARLKSITLSLVKLGANLAGELTWEAAGDEVSDAEPLLGKLCAAHIVLIDGAQGDLLAPLRNLFGKGGKVTVDSATNTITIEQGAKAA